MVICDDILGSGPDIIDEGSRAEQSRARQGRARRLLVEGWIEGSVCVCVCVCVRACLRVSVCECYAVMAIA